MDYTYYYNNVPEYGLCRNNLIYTSLINSNKTKFVQWYYNDSEYHKGRNEVMDPLLMDIKWEREVNMLNYVRDSGNSEYLLNYTVDYENRKVYLDIENVDFWELSGCSKENYDSVLPDWQEQMLDILKMHKDIGVYKFSLHPSSYFIVDGKLKSMNYFFAYKESEPKVTVREHLSHISEGRRQHLFPQMQRLGIDIDTPTDWNRLQVLCFDSFSDQYPQDFINRAKQLFI
jgi:hypothetical protein